MAGIAGVLTRENRKDRVEAMLKTIAHRGEGSWRIEDLPGATIGITAPGPSADRGDGYGSQTEVRILFDGEIYNPREAGQSDADLVLRLYLRYGKVFPAYLYGAFACAIIDHDQLILARDPVGVRPVYWGPDATGSICFASEMKALAGQSNDVQELLPGTVFSSVNGVSGYIPRLPEIVVPDSPQEAARKLRELVLAAVERRLADGAVGACLLSGGLDSSIIAAAVKELGGDLPLVTVGYEGGAPDIEKARIMAEYLGMKHLVLLYSADEIEASVERAVYHLESFDEDCVSGTISNLFASKLACGVTNCILSGEGADELFGGYHHVKDFPGESGKYREMQRLIAVAYNTALQRLDRSMTAHGIHYRTPFLDTEVSAFAAHIPIDWKIRPLDNGGFMEKWLLREAFRNSLPPVIYERKKLRFAGGTGTDGLMAEIAKKHVTEADFNDSTETAAVRLPVRSPTELWYYRIFKEYFPAPCFERLVGRWEPPVPHSSGCP